MDKEFLTLRVVSGLSVAAGAVAMFCDNYLLGACIAIGGTFLGAIFDKDFQDMPTGANYTTKESKPYYKNEFEEYQHYKHCKRHLKK